MGWGGGGGAGGRAPATVGGGGQREGPVASRAPLYLPTLTRAEALRESQLGVAIIMGAPSDARTQALAARARSLLGPEDAVVVVDPAAPPRWLAAEWLEG